MRKLFIIVIAFLLIGIRSIAEDSINKDSVIQIVLLAGQSNMAGAGNYDELDSTLQKRIENVSNRVFLSFNGKPAKPLSYYDNKPSEKYQFLKRFGPELFMGVTLAVENPSKQYLFIKRSQGGTALYGAWNPNWDVKKAKAIEKGELKQNLKLFNLHISDIEKQLDSLRDENQEYKIIGVAWMQGENDAILEEAVGSYRKNLRILISGYRNQFKDPELPFVIGQINSRYGVKGGADKIRKAMLNVGNGDYFAELIKTSTDTSWSDFPKHLDNVHYNTEGQKRLGMAFSNAFSTIKQRNMVEPFKGNNQLIPGNNFRVKAKGNTNMIYNVYLPLNYKAHKKSPIIIAFSPNGNGEQMMQKLKQSAETAGWILVTCDKLKNGMKNIALEHKMEDEALNDIFTNIPHKKNKIYLAGFSGGAMRAYGITARRSEKYAGIIAYGGWLGGDDYQDKKYGANMDVAIVNGINDKGANKWVEIDSKTLSKSNCNIKTFSHSGGHSVAPTEVTDAAIEWLKSKK